MKEQSRQRKKDYTIEAKKEELQYCSKSKRVIWCELDSSRSGWGPVGRKEHGNE
jgi:hypothetical protein